MNHQFIDIHQELGDVNTKCFCDLFGALIKPRGGSYQRSTTTAMNFNIPKVARLTITRFFLNNIGGIHYLRQYQIHAV